MYKFFAAYIAVFVTTFLGVELFRRWSLKREMLDIPNERSSHSVPTPRGGGIIICSVSLLAFLIYFALTGKNFPSAYFVGAAIIAFISLADDVKTISPFFRILFHGLAAGLVVWALGGFESFSIPFIGVVRTGIWGSLITFFWIVWLINAYNFMDGIDGIASMQAITAGIGWSLLGLLWGIEEVVFFGGVLAASAFGFIMLNWQPAKIFMGDVGSAFLGYSFAVMPLFCLKKTETSADEAMMPWVAVIFVWLFVFDSVYTFFRRLFRGEKVWRAHRQHIYQKLVIYGLSHARVTGLYGAASVIPLLGLAAALQYSMNLGKMILPIVFLETIFLILVWVLVVKFTGKQGKAD